MKRFLVSTLAISITAFTITSFASTANNNPHVKWCNWHDNFHFDGSQPVGSHVMKVNSSDFTASTGEITFDLYDKGDCLPYGYATALVGTDYNNMCTLTIKDGSLQMDAEIIANCIGNYVYKGTTYDGFMTYRYTMHFSKS